MKGHKKSVAEVLDTHSKLTQAARDLVARKGRDYNRQAQTEGDTLANLRSASAFGLVPNPCVSVLVRLLDKFNRLTSLTSDPTNGPAVKNESVRDTIIDAINYLVYVYIFYDELTEGIDNIDITEDTNELQETACGTNGGCM